MAVMGHHVDRLGVVGTIVLVIALAGCTNGPVEVAWHPYPTTTTTLPPAPLCQSGQLEASSARGGVGFGNIETTVDLANVGSTCRLQGYPDLIGIAPNGNAPLMPGKSGTFFGNLVASNLPSGHVGELLLGTSGNCDAVNHQDQRPWTTDAYDGLEIVLPQGMGIVAVNFGTGFSFNTACGLSESQLGVPGKVPQYPPPTGTFQALTATIQAPISVSWDSTLSYTVTLHNSSNQPVSLRPCPSYTESFGIGSKAGTVHGQLVSKTYGLNCERRRALAPKGSLTFAMELRLPRATVAGTADLSWKANTLDQDPFAHVAVRVEP